MTTNHTPGPAKRAATLFVDGLVGDWIRHELDPDDRKELIRELADTISRETAVPKLLKALKRLYAAVDSDPNFSEATAEVNDAMLDAQAALRKVKGDTYV